MGKRIRNLPLRTAIVLDVIFFVLLGAALALMTMSLCVQIRHQIDDAAYERVQQEGDLVLSMEQAMYDSTYVISRVIDFSSDENGQEQFEVVYIRLTSNEGFIYRVLSLIGFGCIPFWTLVCAAGAATTIYRLKLREPLAILRGAAQKIAQSDLDFSIEYDAKDEMGQLCVAFEAMRASVLAQNRAQWRYEQERRRQTAAFAHDLRTPLTVLRAQADTLTLSLPQGELDRAQLCVAVERMRTHIARVEQYVSGMNDLRALEEAPIQTEDVPFQALCATLADTGEALCEQHGRAFTLLAQEGADLQIKADRQLIQRVFDNVLSNAVRYAATQVTARLDVREGFLRLCVEDDGPGFGDKTLTHGTEAFYRGDASGTEQGHLGLGLYICAMLARRCEGRVELSNRAQGGAAVNIFFVNFRSFCKDQRKT